MRFTVAIALAISCTALPLAAATYVVVDTGQVDCFDDAGPMTCPQPGQPFYGQDAHYPSQPASYLANGDGTVTDLNTGLMWQQSPDLVTKSTYAQALAGATTFSLAGHSDWRLPTVKELYSLMDFNGNSSASPPVPYIDTGYFDFRFGDPNQGERLIDAQYWSSTEYVGTTMQGDATTFGVNFADGRIKGYPSQNGPGGVPFTAFVRYVRGNPAYGQNGFVDNGDGTVTDLATGLMWQKGDSGAALSWEQGLAYAEGLSLGGHDDWRMPDVKELQTIVDYTRAPDATDPGARGPALDLVFFDITTTESWHWASTTHLEGLGPSAAAYICFGQAFGWMEIPPGSGNWLYLDVHGAGSQRSDPKTGDPNNYPHGFGPQGDEIRISNYVRAVRDAASGASSGDDYLTGEGLGQPSGNEVRVADSGGTPTSVAFQAYGAGQWGVNVAAAAIAGGAREQILTGPGPGAVFGPQARAFDQTGSALAKVNFYAYGTLRYGLNPTGGAVDLDGYDELLTGPGPGAVFGPHVRAFDYDGSAVVAIAKINFFAYATLKYGVNVASGDVDGDGYAELLTGAGPGAIFAPTVRAFDFDAATVRPIARINFNAFATSQYGVNLAGGDVDGDAFAELATAPGPGSTSAFPATFRGYGYDATAVAALAGFDVTPFTTYYGGRPGLGDASGDGNADLACGAGPDPAAAAMVAAFSYDGSSLSPLPGSYIAFAGSYGVNVTVAALGY